MLGLLYLVAWLAPCLTALAVGLLAGVALSQRCPDLPRVDEVVRRARAAAERAVAGRPSRFL